jgi:hypothetical protein
MQKIDLRAIVFAMMLVAAPSVAQEKQPDSATPRALSGKDQVQNDVRKLMDAAYNRNVDVVLRYTHPKIIHQMGGVAKAKDTLKVIFSRLPEMKLVSLTFPKEPTFLKTESHVFAIIPTTAVVEAQGQQIESVNFQFGIRDIKGTKWSYIEGSTINQNNVRTFFTDFPADYKFPATSRRKL